MPNLRSEVWDMEEQMSSEELRGSRHWGFSYNIQCLSMVAELSFLEQFDMGFWVRFLAVCFIIRFSGSHWGSVRYPIILVIFFLFKLARVVSLICKPLLWQLQGVRLGCYGLFIRGLKKVRYYMYRPKPSLLLAPCHPALYHSEHLQGFAK